MIPTSFNSSVPQGPLSYRGGCLHQHTPKGDANNRAVTSTLSMSSTVEISGESRAPLNAASSGVDTYQAVGGVDKVSAPPEANNPYAQTILSFIGLQLERDIADGATKEELQSRLEAGLKGFEEGYDQAFSQLSDSGLLDDSVRESIEETFNQVRAGIASMAEKYDLESPVEGAEPVLAAPAASIAAPQRLSTLSSKVTVEERFTQSYRDLQTIKHMQKIGERANTYDHLKPSRAEKVHKDYTYEVSESRSFNFKLTTQDGDQVTVKISNSQAGSSSLQIPEYGRGGEAKVDLWGGQASEYQLDIDGELDESELNAISDLLDQVGDISETFYSGDLDLALNLASQLDFDGNELSSFKLNLQMSSTEQITGASRYVTPTFDGFVGQSLPAFEPFVQQVQKAGDMAEKMGQSRMMVPDLMEWLGRDQHSSSPFSKLFGPMGRAVI